MANIYKTKLDIKTVRPNFTPIFVQYDHARLEIELLDNGLNYDLSTADRVEFTHVRSDKLVIIHPGEIVTDGTKKIICYEYQGSEMDLVGSVHTSFAIFDADNKKVSSHSFLVEIRKDLRNETFNPAEPNIGLLQTLINDVEHLKENAGSGGVSPEELQELITQSGKSKVTFTPVGLNVVWGNNHNGMFSVDPADSKKIIITNTSSNALIIQIGSHSYYGEVNKHMYYLSDYNVISKSENVMITEPKITQKTLSSLVGRNVNVMKVIGRLQNILEITVPAGANITIRFNYMGFIFEEDEKDEFTEDIIKTVYELTDIKTDGSYYVSNSLLAKQADIALVANEANAMASKWKNKVWVSHGDSLTGQGGWQDYLISRFGLVHTNKGIGGTKAAGNNANAGWQDSRINSFPANVDLITIMFGTNDWSDNVPIGTDVGDTDTYMGALGLIIRKLVTKYPMARIVLMAPPFRTNSTYTTEPPVIPFDNGTNKDMKLYAEAVQYLAWKYGCKFVNMWAEMGVNEINFKSFLMDETWPVHLNDNGKKRFAEVMIGKLSEIEPLE